MIAILFDRAFHSSRTNHLVAKSPSSPFLPENIAIDRSLLEVRSMRNDSHGSVMFVMCTDFFSFIVVDLYSACLTTGL